MPNYFRNLDQTIKTIESERLSSMDHCKLWMHDHLRIMWNLLFMIVLVIFSIWVSYEVSDSVGGNSVIEVVPGVQQLNQSDELLERVIR